MTHCRSVAVVVLLLAGVTLPRNWAFAQMPHGGPDENAANRPAADPSQLETVKKSLEEIRSRLDHEAMRFAALEGKTDATLKDVRALESTAKERADTAWMLTSSALVMLMIPGLALFYCGMVRRKNVLATMMQSMASMAVVGVYWIAVGYALAFGPSVVSVSAFGVEKGGLVGWSWDLVFLHGIDTSAKLPGLDISVYLHVMFQGMFAIITPALISGAVAERIRFWPYCLFMILWVTLVYCPLAHMVWAFNWFDPELPVARRGGEAIGFLGKMGALDFAGGTVVHIAAGMAGLACCLVLGKRTGYPKLVAHPNSMVLTLLGAGLLWFGWFGFNGGSAVASTTLAVSAFAATQAAAAAAGLGWLVVEWLHKGKPTALGLASGIVAGLVAVTPASGFVTLSGGLCIGLIAAGVCYFAVFLKGRLGYDDSLDAFGVHGVGGFVGAILTGVFCSALVQPASADGLFAYKSHRSQLEYLRKDDQKAIREATAAAAQAEAEALAKASEAASRVEQLTKAKDEAMQQFLAAQPGGRHGLARALAEAQKKLDEVSGPVEKAQALAASKTEQAQKLTERLVTLQELADKQDQDGVGALTQLTIQLKAAVFSVVYAFVLSLLLGWATQAITRGNFRTDTRGEAEGLDRTEHGEVGFDFSTATESVTTVPTEPRAASVPRGNGRFEVRLSGAEPRELMSAWTELCQPREDPADPDFLAVYPHVTTVTGATFRCRGGDPAEVTKRLEVLFQKRLGKEVHATRL